MNHLTFLRVLKLFSSMMVGSIPANTINDTNATIVTSNTSATSATSTISPISPTSNIGDAHMPENRPVAV